jgi:hypothetical protein
MYQTTIAALRAMSSPFPDTIFYTTDLGQEGEWRIDAADTISADNTGTILITNDSVRIKRIYNGPLKPQWFGVRIYPVVYEKRNTSTNISIGFYENSSLTIPVADQTTAIQNMLNAAKTETRWVSFDKGYYPFTQLVIPDGMHFEGSNVGEVGKKAEVDGTVFVQLQGANVDAIIFYPTISLSAPRISSVNIHDFILRGNNGNTIGNGISCRGGGNTEIDRNDIANHAILNQLCLFSRIAIRNFPENGFYCRRGGVPAYINNINAFFNGKYGIKWDGESLNRNVIFENCDGDANTAGAMLYIAGTVNSNISIYNARSEYKPTQSYTETTNFQYASPYTIEIGDFGAESVVNIYNAYGNSAQTEEKENSDAVILVSATVDSKIPYITFSGISTQKQSGTTDADGFRSTLHDKRNNVRIPKEVKTGTYYRSGDTHTALTGNNSKIVVGDDGVIPSTVIGNGLILSKSALPGIALWEIDAAVNKKGFAIISNGGNVEFRTLDDNNNSTVVATISKDANGYPVFTEWLLKGPAPIFRITSEQATLFDLKYTGGETDGKTWRWRNSGTLGLYSVNDAGSTAANPVIEFLRNGAIHNHGFRVRERLLLNGPAATIPDLPTGNPPAISSSSIYYTANTTTTGISALSGGMLGQLVIIIVKDNFTYFRHQVTTDTNYLYLKDQTNWEPEINDSIVFIREQTYFLEIARTSASALKYYETDTNYSLTTANSLIKLKPLTASKTLALPAASLNQGKQIILQNLNVGSFAWNLTTEIKLASGVILTTLANQTIYTLLSDGTAWYVTNNDITSNPSPAPKSIVTNFTGNGAIYGRSFVDTAVPISKYLPELYAHQSALCVINDIAFVVYTANETSEIENNNNNQKVRLSIFHIIERISTIIDVAVAGESSGGITISSNAIIGGGQLTKVNNTTIRIFFNARKSGGDVGNQFRILYKDYTISNSATGAGSLGVLKQPLCTLKNDPVTQYELTLANVVEQMKLLFGATDGAKYGTGISMPSTIVYIPEYNGSGVLVDETWWSAVQIKDINTSIGWQTCVLMRSKDGGNLWELLGAPNPADTTVGKAIFAEAALIVTDTEVVMLLRGNKNYISDPETEGTIIMKADVTDLYSFDYLSSPPVSKHPFGIGRPAVLNAGVPFGLIALLPAETLNLGSSVTHSNTSRNKMYVVSISDDYLTWEILFSVLKYESAHTPAMYLYKDNIYVTWSTSDKRLGVNGASQINFSKLQRTSFIDL